MHELLFEHREEDMKCILGGRANWNKFLMNLMIFFQDAVGLEGFKVAIHFYSRQL